MRSFVLRLKGCSDEGISLVKLSSSRQPLRCPYPSLTAGKELGVKDGSSTAAHAWYFLPQCQMLELPTDLGGGPPYLFPSW